MLLGFSTKTTIVSRIHHLKSSSRTTAKKCVSALHQQTYSTDSTSSSDHYDVIICGGGMIGSAMACGLGSSTYMKGKRILLLDAGGKVDTGIVDNPSEIHSNRVCAISPGSVEFLKEVGVWQNVARSQHVERMQVWDACSDAMISFDNMHQVNECGGMEVCTITENNMLVAAAMKTLGECHTDIEVWNSKKIVGCNTPSESRDFTSSMPDATLQLDDGTCLTSKLIIAADGAKSFLAKQAELPKTSWNYNSSAVVCTLQLSEACENFISWQRFLPTGPIALLPLSNSRSSLVWSTTPEHAKELCECPPDELLMQVNDAFWKMYEQDERITSVQDQLISWVESFTNDQMRVCQFPPSIGDVLGPVQRFPLGLSHTHWYCKSRIAFIGDTVHRIHPLAGQGANMGYRDVKNLTRAIEQSIYEGKDFGMLSSLTGYESKSQLENVPFLMVTDAMKRLYSTDALPVVMLRSSGLTLANSIPPLKEFLMKKAMS